MNLDIYKNATAIESKEYELLLLTPMAMHGNNGNNANDRRAEFRVSSLKGMLRYWWRTLQFKYNHSILLENEEAFFGGTETENAGKSKVIFSMPDFLPSDVKVDGLPHKSKGFKLMAIPEDTKWVIKMSVPKSQRSLLSQYDLYVQYMFLLAAMGQRARRGFGSIQWKDHLFSDINSFSHALVSILSKLDVLQSYNIQLSSQWLLSSKLSRHYSHPTLTNVWIGEASDQAQKLLKQIGEATHHHNYDGILGSANPRFASPLWCTIRKIGDRYFPIISELRWGWENKKLVSSSHETCKTYKTCRDEFLKELGVKL